MEPNQIYKLLYSKGNQGQNENTQSGRKYLQMMQPIVA